MWLIGMMGSGRTTVGTLVAEAAGLSFYDIDQVVEERSGTDMAALWTEVVTLWRL